MSVNFKLEALRMQIRALGGHNLETSEDRRILPFGDKHLNFPLPKGGLQLGALHEFTADGLEAELAPAVTAFAAMVASNILHSSQRGFVLWASSRVDCYSPGLARFGLDPARVIWVECRKDSEVLGVMEEALHSRALAAVFGEAGGISLKTGRKLDAAARLTGCTALLLRRQLFKPPKASEGPSGAAATRWRVRAAPSKTLRRPTPLSSIGERDGEPGLGPPRWQLDLEYCRNGRTASWIVEASDGADSKNHKASHVRVVAELRDDPRTLEEAPARKTGRTARAS